jgi:tRNA/tmRNA/rRNA uracil-C5-methylase (TrmA/RlmC/RlmD family)
MTGTVPHSDATGRTATGSTATGSAAHPVATGSTVQLVAGAIAAGGGCVARTDDGRVAFVRHALPGERVVAEVTSSTTSFLRADAVTILEASPDRVAPPCRHAGPGGCGGCDWQHVALPAQRLLKSALIAEQLHRLARLDLEVAVEEVDGSVDGLAWRTRMQFAVDRAGRIGLHRHRSHDVEPIEHCPLATAEVNRVGVGTILWRGARHVEVTASPDGGPPVIAVEAGRNRLAVRPPADAGLVVDGRTRRRPSRVRFEVQGHHFEVSAGVFWQVHPAAARLLADCVIEGLQPVAGERAVDLYAGAGLFTVALARVVGKGGSVEAVERNRRACADVIRNTEGMPQVRVVRSDVTAAAVSRLDRPDVLVLDPSRQGAGQSVMGAITNLDPAPRRVAYVSCDPATFARDLKVALDAGWGLSSLRAFDLFPMTEHVELVGLLEPPGGKHSNPGT